MRVLLLIIAAVLAFAQVPQPIPYFTSASIRPFQNDSKSLAPNMVVELYGQNLAPGPWCGQDRIPKESLPLEFCDVRVLVGSSLAGLMFVSPRQINLKIPANATSEGTALIRVCVRAVCSEPVSMRFSTHTAFLTLENPAYVHMPVWIHVDAPWSLRASQPCAYWPWSLAGYQFEVFHNGHALTRLPQASNASTIYLFLAGICLGQRANDRLPLHLLYAFDEPGLYSVRLTASKGSDVLYQSDWTTIQIQPFSEKRRDEWLGSIDAKIGQLNVEYVVPSLLAWPDEKALEVLLKVIPPDLSCSNSYDCALTFGLGRAALAVFGDNLLRRIIPASRLSNLCPPDGDCN